MKRSIESLLTMCRLCTLTFRKRAKDTYQICKDLCPNNILHLVSNPPTTTLKKWPNRQGAKGRKRGQYKSCLATCSFFSLHVHTSITLSHMQLWAERQGKLSIPMPRRSGNHEKNLAIRKFLSQKFSIMGFSAISQKF